MLVFISGSFGLIAPACRGYSPRAQTKPGKKFSESRCLGDGDFARITSEFPLKRVPMIPLLSGSFQQLNLIRIRRRNAKMSNGIVSLTLGVCLLLIGGCVQKGGIEGEYIDIDSPDLSMIIKGGRFQQGGADIHTTGTYAMRQIDANTYELDVSYTNPKLQGHKSTITIARDGDFITAKNRYEERKFKRK